MSFDNNAVTIAVATEMLREYVARDIAVFLWGPVGVGKSSVVAQTADALGRGFVDFRLNIREPIDLGGMPYPDPKTGVARRLVPSELPQVKRDGETGILFVDELNTADRSMQPPAYGLILERRVGEYRLPSGWTPVAAGNRASDRAIAQRLSSALSNRFAHITVAPDATSFIEYAMTSSIHPAIPAFIKWRPELLHVMPTDDENAFPTPRAWETVGKLADARPSIRQRLVCGVIGEKAAAEFEGFMRTYLTLPPLKEIESNPKTCPVPGMDEPSALYALAMAIARIATPKNFDKVGIYINRLPQDIAILTMIACVKRTPSLKSTKTFTDWAVKNQEVIL